MTCYLCRAFRRMICEGWRGHIKHKDRDDQEGVPLPIREASHTSANLTAELQGSVVRFRKEVDFLSDLAVLASKMRGEPQHDSGINKAG